MSNEIKLLAEFISTSYGPYGRTKVIKAANGTCIITKEGQQLIDALYNVDNHVLVKLMLNDAKKIASSFGDGSSTFVITAAELIHTLVDQKAQSVANIQRRFALEIILEACSCNQSAIANELIRNKIWLQGHSNVDQAQFEFLCRAVLRNTISPATRDNIAELIEHLVV